MSTSSRALVPDFAQPGRNAMAAKLARAMAERCARARMRKVRSIILEILLFIPDFLDAKIGGTQYAGERAPFAAALAHDAEPFLVAPAVQKGSAELRDDILAIRLQVFIN